MLRSLSAFDALQASVDSTLHCIMRRTERHIHYLCPFTAKFDAAQCDEFLLKAHHKSPRFLGVAGARGAVLRGGQRT